ncbi:uncharacterized protein ACB058_019604 [Synchiropus picturatus]
MNKASVVNRRDRHGRTALSHACQRGDLEAVKTLIRNNADPEVVDVWGNTALMYAAAEGHSSVVEFLVRAFKRLGVQLDRYNKAGNSAVEVARVLGHTDCLTALTGCGGTRRGAPEESDRKLGHLVRRLQLLQTSGPGRPGSMECIEEGETESSCDPGLRRVLLPKSKSAQTRKPAEELLPPLVQSKSFSPRPNRAPAARGVTLTTTPMKDPRAVKSSVPAPPPDPLRPHKTFSVFGAKLLRRFTAPDIKHDVTAFNKDPIRIPRSETFPLSASHPQVDLTVSVDSISSVKCEFDFHFN